MCYWVIIISSYRIKMINVLSLILKLPMIFHYQRCQFSNFLFLFTVSKRIIFILFIPLELFVLYSHIFNILYSILCTKQKNLKWLAKPMALSTVLVLIINYE